MNLKGKIGEEIGCRYLKGKGYAVLNQNYRTRYGEIDIVCQREKKIVVFCEVKHYRKNAMVPSLEYISKFQKQKIINSANLYIQEFQSFFFGKDVSFRFDILLIEGGRVKQHLHNVDFFNE